MLKFLGMQLWIFCPKWLFLCSFFSSAMISPGPWSPVTTTATVKGWDRENNQQNVPSFEEIQRMEEEKEKQAMVRQ